jgi:hypothetical protein
MRFYKDQNGAVFHTYFCFFARIAIVPDHAVAVVTASSSRFAGAVTQTLMNVLLEEFAAG